MGWAQAWVERRLDASASRAGRAFAQAVGRIPLDSQPAPPTIPLTSDPGFGAVARYAIGRAISRSWVSRRNETFTFIDANTVRRHMSVDFTLPRYHRLAAGDMVLVPIMLLEKTDLRNLDVRDEGGTAIPVLTTDQHSTVARIGLREMLGADADGEVDLALEAIIQEGEEPESYLGEGSALLGALSKLEKKQRARVNALIQELQGAFMLLVPVEYWPGRRHIRKLSYDAALKPQTAGSEGRTYIRFNRFGSSLGLFGRLEHFTDLAVGLGTSYHAEVVPAPDTYVAEASLFVTPAGRFVSNEPVRDEHAFRPHLRVATSDRSDTGRLGLTIHARREELIAPLCFSSLVISAVLAFVPRHANTLEGQTLAALLLLPFALSAFYVRSAENTYASRMLIGVRSIAALPVIAGAVVIGLIAVGSLPPEPGHTVGKSTLDVTRAAFLVAAAPALILTAVLSVPLVGRALRRPLRRREERVRGAARAAEEVQEAAREAPKGAFSKGQKILIVLVSLSILGGIIFGGYELASSWWSWAQPSGPRPILQTT